MKQVRIRDILFRISNQDEAAFNELFNHYYPKLIQLALALVPGIFAAQEVVSDIFYKILKNPKNLEMVNNFDNYIFRAVKNQSLSYIKKHKHRALIDTIDQKEDYILPDYRNPENSLISEELFLLVNQTIQELPPRRKIVFLLVKEEGKKYKEVAEILDISTKTVEIQMSHALKKIRKIVVDYQQSKDVTIKRIDGTNNIFNIIISLFF